MREKTNAMLEHTFSEPLVAGDKTSLKTDNMQMLKKSAALRNLYILFSGL
jgi:hypothetical protein